MPAKSSIGTSAVPLAATAAPVTYGVFLFAPPTNGGPVFFGYSDAVTAGTADATDGLPVYPGAFGFATAADFRLAAVAPDAANLYLISDGTGRKLYYWADAVPGAAGSAPLGTAGAAAVNLAQVGGSAIALGQALAAASLPVVLTAAQLAALSAPVPVASAGALTDRSGTVTSGGTAQTVAAANSSRKWFFIQNVSSADLWFNFGTAAVAAQPSIKLPPGAAYESGGVVSTGLVSVYGATTGQAFAAKEL